MSCPVLNCRPTEVVMNVRTPSMTLLPDMMRGSTRVMSCRLRMVAKALSATCFQITSELESLVAGGSSRLALWAIDGGLGSQWLAATTVVAASCPGV